MFAVRTVCALAVSSIFALPLSWPAVGLSVPQAACRATVDMFHLTKDDFCPQVEKVLTVGDFYELSAGGQIIFT